MDKSREPGFDLAKIPAEELPTAMRTMNLAQKRAFLAKKQKERDGLQKQLLALGTKRSEFLKQANAKVGRKDSLDAAVSGSFGAQAAMGGFGGFGGGK